MKPHWQVAKIGMMIKWKLMSSVPRVSNALSTNSEGGLLAAHIGSSHRNITVIKK